MQQKRPGEENTDDQRPAKKAKIADTKAEPKKGTIFIDIDGTVFKGKIAADIEKNRDKIKSEADVIAIIDNRELIGEAKDWNATLTKLVEHYDICFISRNHPALQPGIAAAIKNKMQLDDNVFEQLRFDCRDIPDKTPHITQGLSDKPTLEEKLRSVYLDNDAKEVKLVIQTGLLLAAGCVSVGWVHGALPHLQKIDEHFKAIDAEISRLKFMGQLNEMGVRASNDAYLKAEAAEKKKETTSLTQFTFVEDPQSTGKSVDELEPVQDNSLKLDLLPEDDNSDSGIKFPHS